MKKQLLTLVAMVCLSISVSAGVVFRSQQSVCSGNEQVILKSNGTCQVWTSSTLQYSGTYTIEGDIIIMSFEGGKFRAKAEMNSSKTKLFSLTFNNTLYRTCSK